MMVNESMAIDRDSRSGSNHQKSGTAMIFNTQSTLYKPTINSQLKKQTTNERPILVKNKQGRMAST